MTQLIGNFGIMLNKGCKRVFVALALHFFWAHVTFASSADFERGERLTYAHKWNLDPFLNNPSSYKVQNFPQTFRIEFTEMTNVQPLRLLVCQF